jgi:hypothetical protein
MKIIIRINPEIISIRPEVVVNDIEDDGEAQRVSFVHERAQIVRRSVKTRRREEIHAIIAPAVFAGEIRHRHHLDDRDSNLGQLR